MNYIHLENVSGRIGDTVIRFWELNLGREFHADDLRRYVSNLCGYVAPGSSDRILRDLRKKRKINYILVSRPKSLYKAVNL